MVRVTKTPTYEGVQMTADIEVGGSTGSHSYQIAAGDVNVISHNSVSLLAGATPGVHFPISRTYIRRVRLMKGHSMIAPMVEAGYTVEPCQNSPDTTSIIEIPIKMEDNIRTIDEATMWEKLALTQLMQRYWSDNQVSVTIDFDAETEGKDIKSALEYCEDSLKSVSFLPRFKNSTAYPQMPYEEIDEERYDSIMAKLKPVQFGKAIKKKSEDIQQEVFCDGDSCTLTS